MMPRIIVPPRERSTPYGDTAKERRIFLTAFSKVAGKMSVADVAKEMNLNESQVRAFANRSGWSIKYVPNK